MTMSLDRSRLSIRQAFVDLAWAEWNRLGVYGKGRKNMCSVDIEAAIIHGAYAGWMDERLFDGILSWINVYCEAISPERLAALLVEYDDSDVARCVGAMIESTAFSKNPVQWKNCLAKLAKRLEKKKVNASPFWQSRADRAWIERDKIFSKWGLSREKASLTSKLNLHDVILRDNALIRYRYMTGVSARSDILYLLDAVTRLGIGIDASQLAAFLGYHHSSVFRILQSLESGGIIAPHGLRRARNTSWKLAISMAVSNGEKKEKKIINWRMFTCVLIRMFLALESIDWTMNRDLLAHRIHGTYLDAFSQLCESGICALPAPASGPLKAYSSEDLLAVIDEAFRCIANDVTAQ